MTTDPPEPAEGYVNITVEIFDYKGVRTNIVRESLKHSEFLAPLKAELTSNRIISATRREILKPSVKTEMT